MVDKNQLHFAIRTLATLAGFSLMTGALAMEVRVFSISDFVPVAAAGCGGNDMPQWPVVLDAWYDEMAVYGHTQDGQHTDGNMTIQRFCDPDWITGCQDHQFLDEADAAMIGTHGLDSGDHWSGTMRIRLGGQCSLDAGGFAQDMHVGDEDLDFIHLSSCYSADDDNLDGIRYAMHDLVDSGFARQWNGFHGVMWVGLNVANDYKDFADDAHTVSMSSAWVSNNWVSNNCQWFDLWNYFDTCQDQCPVAYAIGPHAIGALTRLNNERYNHIFPPVPGYSAYAIRYYVGCDPVGETAFSF